MVNGYEKNIRCARDGMKSVIPLCVSCSLIAGLRTVDEILLDGATSAERRNSGVRKVRKDIVSLENAPLERK